MEESQRTDIITPLEQTVLSEVVMSKESDYLNVDGRIIMVFFSGLLSLPVSLLFGYDDPQNTIVLMGLFTVLAIPIPEFFKSFTAPIGVNASHWNVRKRTLKKAVGKRIPLETVEIEQRLGKSLDPHSHIRTSDHRGHTEPNVKVEEAFVLIGNKIFLEQKIVPLLAPLWEATFNDIMALEAVTAKTQKA